MVGASISGLWWEGAAVPTARFFLGTAELDWWLDSVVKELFGVAGGACEAGPGGLVLRASVDL